AKLVKAPEYVETVAGIESVKRAILRTTAGMDRLLEAEQLRHGSANLDIHTVDLSQLLLEVSQQWQYEAQLKGLELRVEVPDGAKVSSDERLLTLVLQNLLGNAVKYSSTGAINISAGNTSDSGVAVWIFSISDQGPGIPLESLTKLFEAFKRGDTYGKPGVGLGLSIATHAAKLLGGELRVESKVGVGSTFQLVLPTRNSSPVWAVPDTA
ncbi:MAG TPA: HAMP domain-containing sensor histidine kinase, partial [Nitrosospira sp.]|nr:HAMP domain-containing sensor histidine kinase [Nitrosospira sp.]